MGLFGLFGKKEGSAAPAGADQWVAPNHATELNSRRDEHEADAALMAQARSNVMARHADQPAISDQSAFRLEVDEEYRALKTLSETHATGAPTEPTTEANIQEAN